MRFPEFNDEWERTTLGEILSIGNGKDYKHLSSGNIPVFGTGGHMTSVNNSLMDGESVFIGRKGTIDKPFYYNGKFWVVDTLFYTHSYNGALPKFILYIASNINWLKYNEASGVPSLSKITIQKIPIHLPLPAEQQKIATFLSLLDERIEAQRQTIEERKKQKKALLQQIFSQSLRFPKFADEWQQTTLGEISEFKKGSPISKEQLSEHGNPVILYGELYTTYKNEVISSVYSKTKFEKGTLEISQGGEVLIPSSGETAWDIAIARCIIQPGVILGGDLNILRVNNNDGCFLSYLLSGGKKKKIAEIAQGSSVIHLYSKDLGKLSISLPSLSEQQKIASFLSLLDTQIEVEERLLQKYEEQKRYLFRKMFV